MFFLKNLARCISIAVIIGLVSTSVVHKVSAQSSSNVIINEIAWMGTTVDYNNEWIELYNPTSSDVN